uniref:CD7 antigen n=1 Tax=Nannospalax galili TaxID=1026970 RepID=A0A8C6RPY8_NANGA
MSQQALLGLPLALVGGLPESLSTQVVQQSPLYAIIPEGGSINITCTTRGAPLYGIFLKQSWPRVANVIYYSDGKESTVDKRFSGRIDFLGSQNNLTITMHLLQLNDSAIYSCHAIMEKEVQGSGTMVAVTEKLSQGESRPQKLQVTLVALLTGLPVGFFLTGLILGVLCTLKKTQIKKLCTSRDKNSRCVVVYEDMSYSNRNTPCAPNQYH